MYVAPLVARSNISDSSYKLFERNENIKKTRKEVAKEERKIINIK